MYIYIYNSARGLLKKSRSEMKFRSFNTFYVTLYLAHVSLCTLHTCHSVPCTRVTLYLAHVSLLLLDTKILKKLFNIQISRNSFSYISAIKRNLM